MPLLLFRREKACFSCMLSKRGGNCLTRGEYSVKLSHLLFCCFVAACLYQTTSEDRDAHYLLNVYYLSKQIMCGISIFKNVWE